MPIQGGKRYVFINIKSGTALDLDTGDNRTVQGWTRHGGPNQQWEAIPQSEDKWMFKNVQQGGHLGREGINDGSRIICTPGIFNWTVELQLRHIDENIYKIVAAASSKCVDLSNGNNADGTRVQIWTNQFANANQQWQAQEV